MWTKCNIVAVTTPGHTEPNIRVATDGDTIRIRSPYGSPIEMSVENFVDVVSAAQLCGLDVKVTRDSAFVTERRDLP